jgi:hypothetical protein
MSAFWQSLLDPGVLLILFIFGGGILWCITDGFVEAWKQNRDRERNAVLKQQMLDKGMSADDIVRVIEARPRKNDALPSV